MSGQGPHPWSIDGNPVPASRPLTLTTGLGGRSSQNSENVPAGALTHPFDVVILRVL